jgi:hypothetical protein
VSQFVLLLTAETGKVGNLAVRDQMNFQRPAGSEP